MLIVLLLQCLAIVLAEIQPQWRMDNGNSLLTGRMTPELIKELADVAYSLLKADRRVPGRRRKKPKVSFMDYDDAMRAENQDMAVDAPAPMIMFNNQRLSFAKRKKISRKPLPLSYTVQSTLTYNQQKHALSPPPGRYLLPPEGISHHKGRRWTVDSTRRYRIHHGRGRRIREPVPLSFGRS